MEKGTVRVICGPGCGKTVSAIGYGIAGVSHHKNVIIIQFLKGELDEYTSEILKRLEPDMKVFRFEKSQELFENLTEDQKKEELLNIRNGFNFTKKVMATRECDMLILDEILELVDRGIVTLSELVELLKSRAEEIDVVLTGKICPEELVQYVNTVSRIENIKVDNFCK